MSFATWLGNHVMPSKLISEDEKDGQTISLRERDSNVNMTLRIENVPKTVVVVRFDDGHRREIFESGKGYQFGYRCDYLILEESDTEYTAIFVELKKNFEDLENESWSEKKGEKQLRWSLPCLKYLLSVFETDTYSLSHDKKLTARYFLIAKSPNPWFRKRRNRGHFISEEYAGIPIHYSTKDKIKLKELKTRESLPVLG